MASYASDEEQIEALSGWWKENGNSLIIGIIVVLAVLFGSRQWQSSQTATSEAASDLFQSLVEISAVGAGVESTDENLETALELNLMLREEFSTSIYRHYAALLMARLYVEHGELDMAATELNWVLDNPDLGMFQSADEELFLTTRLRLARVILAQGEAQTALDTLSAVEPGTFTGSYAEVKGDAYVVLGRIDDARTAYGLALETATNPALLGLKLEDLGE